MHLVVLPRVIERVAGKFFFSPLVSSRGIRDDIEEEDEQVSDHTISIPLLQEPLCLNLYLSSFIFSADLSTCPRNSAY